MLEDKEKSDRIGATEPSMSEHRKKLVGDVVSGTNLNYVQAAYGISLDLPGLSAEMAQLLVQMPGIIASAAYGTGVGDATTGEELQVEPEVASAFEVSSIEDGSPHAAIFEDYQPEEYEPGFGGSEYYSDLSESLASIPPPTRSPDLPAVDPVQSAANSWVEQLKTFGPSPETPPKPPAKTEERKPPQSGVMPSGEIPVAGRAPKRDSKVDTIVGTPEAKAVARQAVLREADIDLPIANALLRAASEASAPSGQATPRSNLENTYPSTAPQELSGHQSDFVDAVVQFTAASTASMQSATNSILENARRLSAIENLLDRSAT